MKNKPHFNRTVLWIVLYLLIFSTCFISCISPQKMAIRKQHNHYIIGDYQLIYHFDTLWLRDKHMILGMHIDSSGDFNHGIWLDSMVHVHNN